MSEQLKSVEELDLAVDGVETFGNGRFARMTVDAAREKIGPMTQDAVAAYCKETGYAVLDIVKIQKADDARDGSIATTLVAKYAGETFNVIDEKLVNAKK